jgi:L-arabinokinase
VAACRRARASSRVADGAIPRPKSGLVILLQSDFPPSADLGRPCATAAAVLDGLCKFYARELDLLSKATLASESVTPLTGLRRTRVAMTAFCGAGDGSLLRMKFHPQVICDPFLLPPGIIITAIRTQLARPTTRERLLETRLCAEMGERMIQKLRRADGHSKDGAITPLAAITPVDFLERYRYVLPHKTTLKAFTAAFGPVRGLDGNANAKMIYKVRSRSEHHIYENQRVHEFINAISRARRTGAIDALIEAGEKMYASHWSHSQRCGIGGAETDLIKDFIRARGPADGLFGAKVTGGGAGGELVVLMRDDEKARAALAEAIRKAGAASKRLIETYGGSLGGADSFQPPELSGLLAAV